MKIRIHDNLHPEDNAMLQALYARSAESVDVHMEKVKEAGSGKFMSKWYVGYGHKSIADCGSTTIFIEGVSMLAAKAIQDWPLYSGQETSTRAVDMTQMGCHDPLQTSEGPSIGGELINHSLMQFYSKSYDEVAAHVRAKYPKLEDEPEKTYENAVKARTFDILRGFLPAGLSTQLSWHTNLRQAADHLGFMKHHPLAEVRTIAERILGELGEKYPDSFSSRKNPEVEEYNQRVMREYNYYDPRAWTEPGEVEACLNDTDMLYNHMSILKDRPKHAVLPHFLGAAAYGNFSFLLDFGSFRDLQRHRNGVCRMPLLTTKFGFEPWYFQQLPDPVRDRADELLKMVEDTLWSMNSRKYELQYYIPMGYRVPCLFHGPLPSLIYLVELRTQKTVHPTFRIIAQKMASKLLEAFPDVRLHIDNDMDDWSLRRGRHLELRRRETEQRVGDNVERDPAHPSTGTIVTGG